MILAFDTYYQDSGARTVALAFKNWKDKEPFEIHSHLRHEVEVYIPGEFYRRELPCILELLNQLKYENIEAIVIDGFVYLDDALKPGLGAHLYHALHDKIPIIGVAKTNFATVQQTQIALIRGKSASPLFITSIGIELDEAAKHIQSMSGEHRIPDLLRLLDQKTREK